MSTSSEASFQDFLAQWLFGVGLQLQKSQPTNAAQEENIDHRLLHSNLHQFEEKSKRNRIELQELY